MALLRRGSSGHDVSELQSQLHNLGFTDCPVSGEFDADTENEVIEFQMAKGLSTDGVVGPTTWAAIFTDRGPSDSQDDGDDGQDDFSTDVTAGSLAQRCLSMSGSFETSKKAPQCYAGLSGDFDGQGISFGALQWNLGQGSLQPMLQEMDTNHPDIIDMYFGQDAQILRNMLTQSRPQQLSWARSIQNASHVVQQPWKDQFTALGLSDEYQQIQVKTSLSLFNAAKSWCPTYDIHSERAVALMFDIRVQNGSISAATKALILQDFANLPSTGDPQQDEINRLVIIANRRADAANPPWQNDVRARKLTVAEGSGVVHGASYDIEADFGITMNPAV